MCDLENLKNEEAMTRVGSQRHSKKKNTFYLNTLRFQHTIIYFIHLK